MIRSTFIAAPRLAGIQEEDDNSEDVILETSEHEDSADAAKISPILRIADKLFVHKRQALNFDDYSMAEALKFQPLSIAIDDQNRECIHYARGCQSILRNYLSDADTSIEYSTDDQLRNIDNPLLLKAQSVIEVGLRRHNLREELYCQALVGLHLARTGREIRLAWIFLTLMAGCFLPSHRLRPFFEDFLVEKKNENNQDAMHCHKKLIRSTQAMQQAPPSDAANGDIFYELRQQRRAPPCSLEFWAAVRKTTAAVSVICPDEARRSVAADSASTSQEIVESVCTRLEIKDSFGFALFLRAGQRVAPVGEGGVYLMDAIWQAERFSVEQGLEPPKLHFRRDVFPLRWHPEKDRPAARLVFSQVCSSVKNGENQTSSSQDLALLVAYQYLLEFEGLEPTDKRLSLHCNQVMPANIYKAQKSYKKDWIRMVGKTLTELKKEDPTEIGSDQVIEKVVRYSLTTWPHAFSRKYELRGFTCLGTSESQNSHVTLEINHKTVSIKSPEGNDHLSIATRHIKKCFLLSPREDGLGRIQIATDEQIYTLVTPFSTELHKVMNRLIA